MEKRLFQGHINIPVLSVLLLFLLIHPLYAQTFAPNYTDPATGMEFVLVPGGCFEMGNKWGGGSYTEYPVHEVCVSAYYLGKTEVTQGQWQAVMGENPSYFKLADNYPVDSVSRIDAAKFLNEMNGDTLSGYRLPTEAEWEFACRSGGKDQQYCGGDSPDDYAWYEKNSGDVPHPVAQKNPNGLGLYDMSGNVWEFCSDIFAKDYYETGPKQNPQGATSGRHLIKRGGTWGINENFQRAATRARGGMEEAHFSTGFRVALPAVQVMSMSQK